MKKGFRFISASLLLFVLSCTSPKKITTPTTTSPVSGIGKLHFLNEYVVPNDLLFKGTVVGGLSGIDYDAKNNIYYLICDDRSDKNPARFYKARISVTEKGINSVEFTNVVSLLDPQGKAYGNRRTDSLHTPDPESIRYNAVKNELTWSSEGDRVLSKGSRILIDPAIYTIDLSGKYKGQFTMPPNLKMQEIQKGPRQNGVLEGLAFSNDYKYLFASVEEPLYEDGPRAGSGDSSAWIRILKFDAATKKQVAQYAYQIAPVAYPPDPPGGFRINGISEILNIGNDKLLVMERSFSTGKAACTIRLYEANLSQAGDISAVASLQSTPAEKPVIKRLLLNMDDLGRYIDNVEGVTFGPLLPNGHRTLVFVADNNFDAGEKMQFFLFEVL
jgi:hypothetical protein